MSDDGIVLVGVRGAGKSTTATALAAQWGCTVTSADAMAWDVYRHDRRFAEVAAGLGPLDPAEAIGQTFASLRTALGSAYDVYEESLHLDVLEAVLAQDAEVVDLGVGHICMQSESHQQRLRTLLRGRCVVEIRPAWRDEELLDLTSARLRADGRPMERWQLEHELSWVNKAGVASLRVVTAGLDVAGAVAEVQRVVAAAGHRDVVAVQLFGGLADRPSGNRWREDFFDGQIAVQTAGHALPEGFIPAALDVEMLTATSAWLNAVWPDAGRAAGRYVDALGVVEHVDLPEDGAAAQLASASFTEGGVLYCTTRSPIALAETLVEFAAQTHGYDALTTARAVAELHRRAPEHPFRDTLLTASRQQVSRLCVETIPLTRRRALPTPQVVQPGWTEVRAMTPEEFEALDSLPDHPLRIVGAMDAWPAMGSWSIDRFEERYGQLEVTVRQGYGVSSTSVRTTLADFIDYARHTIDPVGWYLVDWGFAHIDPTLLADYEVPRSMRSWHWDLPPEDCPELRSVYLGPQGSGSSMHVDILMTSAWNGLIEGRKRWAFAPGSAAEQIRHGSVDVFRPGTARQTVAAAPVQVCVQEPGDLVYTPSGWWHQVHNDTLTLAVTENFVNGSNADAVLACPWGDQHPTLAIIARQLRQAIEARRGEVAAGPTR